MENTLELETNWTRALVPDITAYVNYNFKQMDCYLKQFFSEYDHFKAYWKIFNLSESEKVFLYSDMPSTHQHAVLKCDK